MTYRSEESARDAKAAALTAELRDLTRERDALAERNEVLRADTDALQEKLSDLGYEQRSIKAAAKRFAKRSPFLGAGMATSMLLGGLYGLEWPLLVAILGASFGGWGVRAYFDNARRARIDAVEADTSRE